MPENVSIKCRVYIQKDDLAKLPQGVVIEEEYPAFVTLFASKEAIAEIRKRYPVEETHTLKPPPDLPSVAGLSGSTPKQKGPYTLVLRFRAPIRQEWVKEIVDLGCEYYDAIGRATIVVRCNNRSTYDRLETLLTVEHPILPFIPVINISPEFFQNLSTNAELVSITDKLPGILIVSLFTKLEQQRTKRALRRAGIQVIGEAGDMALLINLKNHTDPESAVQVISKRQGLRRLEEKTIESISNDIARMVVADQVVTEPPAGLGLTGKGEVIAVADTGLDTGDTQTIHLDFRGRVRWMKSYPINHASRDYWKFYQLNLNSDDGVADIYSGHGTHVCGSILGNGTRSKELGMQVQIVGIAPDAELVFQATERTLEISQEGQQQWHMWNPKENIAVKPHGLVGIPDDLQILLQDAYEQGAYIHSNSWGIPNPSDLGQYLPHSYAIDNFTWQHRDFLVVISAGNEANHVPQGDSSITPPSTAKNCLTVGACGNQRNGDSINNVTDFSSRGPTKKGRRKPDLVAPGTHILSTRSSLSKDQGWGEFGKATKDYLFNGGTSMATPIVAGCAALVRQYLRTTIDIDTPSSALLKAALIHSAKYMTPNSVIKADNEQGWGRIDLKEILNPSAPLKTQFIEGARELQTGDERTFRVAVADATVPLRITLAYTDTPGDELTNNLNLIAYAPDGSYFIGNDFEGIGVMDRDNNVEGIIIEKPQTGVWNIHVIASDIPDGPQDFALVISGGSILLQ